MLELEFTIVINLCKNHVFFNNYLGGGYYIFHPPPSSFLKGCILLPQSHTPSLMPMDTARCSALCDGKIMFLPYIGLKKNEDNRYLNFSDNLNFCHFQEILAGPQYVLQLWDLDFRIFQGIRYSEPKWHTDRVNRLWKNWTQNGYKMNIRTSAVLTPLTCKVVAEVKDLTQTL